MRLSATRNPRDGLTALLTAVSTALPTAYQISKYCHSIHSISARTHSTTVQYRLNRSVPVNRNFLITQWQLIRRLGNRTVQN